MALFCSSKCEVCNLRLYSKPCGTASQTDRLHSVCLSITVHYNL